MSQMQYALITGASSGIGWEFAKQLAARGYGLILVARRLDRLQALKDEIQKSHAVPIEIVSQDLSVLDAAEQLFGVVQRQQLNVEILINNAGFGIKNAFLESDGKRMQDMALLNINTLTQLTLLFGREFQKKKSGFILQLSSIAGFQASPGMAMYSATKAYVQSLGEALYFEFKKDNVHMTTLCPGTTLTEFFEVAGQNVPKSLQKLGMTAEAVARVGLKAMFAKKPVVLSGLSNKINIGLLRLLPRLVAARIVGFVVRKAM
jgi:uncharacterized protein